jgi:hypothetical protein
MNVDPAASMRCWALDIQLGGRTFEIPALPAADWWPVLVDADLARILDFVVSSDALDELLLTGELGAEELGTVLTDALEETAGRSFHVAYILAAAAVAGWPTIGGELARRGFRWDLQPLGAALDAVYFTVMSNIEKKEDRDKFVRLLENDTLTRKGKRRGPDRDKIIAEFETMAGPKPTGGRTATGGQSGSAPPRTPTQPRPLRRGGRSTEPMPPPAGPS